ncbi:MAG: hypothetical protein FJ387_25365 [Verrucomicrobia bacterium]|nr:hypothetical protein [Verrucomicrobiota bacterium]
MKKLGKIALGLTGGGAALVLAAMLSALTGLDREPYLRASYYATTQARLAESGDSPLVVQGDFEAGFGRVPLTPTIEAAEDDPASGQFRAVPLAGYGARRGRPATGRHDELYAKAVALRVAPRWGVMIGADALIIPREVAEATMVQLAEDPGLTRAQVYFSATHTHAGPGGWGEGFVSEAFAGPYQPAVRTWFAGQLVAAARAAVADLRPAALGQGRFEAPKFVRNRLVGSEGEVDSEFSFAVVQQAGGRMGVWGAYAAHATVLSADVFEFSGDYPGSWQRGVEQATGGWAMFLAGGMGSHSPVPGGRGFAGAEQMGQALADEVVRRLPELELTNRIAFGLLGLEVTLPELHVRLSEGLRLRPALARHVVPVRGDTYLQVFRLQDTMWVSTPCDFSGELALGIKADLLAQDLRAVITSFNGDYIGYVIPAMYYHLGGYEPRTMSFFGPTVPDYFNRLIRQMTATLGTDAGAPR